MPDATRKVLNEIADANFEIDRRLEKLEAREYSLIKPCTATALFTSETLTAITTYTSPDAPSTLGIPAFARGIIGSFWITPTNASSVIYFAASPATPAAGDQIYYWYSNGADTERELISQTMFLFLGTDGKITIQASTTVVGSLNVFGYWL